MTKKVRRVRRSTKTKRAENNGPSAETIEETPVKPQTTVEDEFKKEYAYVLKDLRRVFILAAAMFLLLIVLNLILG
jgi:hypothetical protein